MSETYIPLATRNLVTQRANRLCEYCGIADAIVFAPHEPDHIVATQHGGLSILENLALACWQCNRHKGTNLASIDPHTGKREFLYNPRTDSWSDHFKFDGPKIIGISAGGRATVNLLKFNSRDRLELRARIAAVP